MILSGKDISDRLKEDFDEKSDPLVITSGPEAEKIRKTGAAAVDLRLGTWFLTTKARRQHLIDVYRKDKDEGIRTNTYYVPFDSVFVLHPNYFVLATTLEWIRLPYDVAGYITGRSSWGRHGLIIQTAPGVHPGFSGCLTLELTNIGDVPILVKPGTRICQLFLHAVNRRERVPDESRLIGRRQPVLRKIEQDEFEKKLRRET